MVAANSDFRFPTLLSGSNRPVHRYVKPLRWSVYRAPLTSEDLRIHAWLSQRLATLHRERQGLWAKVSQFLFGHRPTR